MELEIIQGDRRADRRYPLELDLHCRLQVGRQYVPVGAGVTTDISKGGIAFRVNRTLAPGARVELVVSWPVRLNNERPLKLLVSGRIVRSDGTWAAVATSRLEFRTYTARPFRAHQRVPAEQPQVQSIQDLLN